MQDTIAAQAALAAHSAYSNTTEDTATQAADLIADVLLLFTPDEADLILRRVARYLDAEQGTTTPAHTDN
ncbi:hypothetical protein [Streptomyces sp. YIM S03343]